MKRTRNILITGGSGMIGTRLTMLLRQKGYVVAHLGRSKKNSEIITFVWDPYRREIEKDALSGVDVIVHLAGAGIAERRWNEKWKREILKSRTEPTRFLNEILDKDPNSVATFISSSGINYYGLEDPNRALTELDAPGTDFMSDVTLRWEAEVDKLSAPGRRIVKIRTGVVLSKDSVALKRLTMPVRLCVGAPIGSGDQFFNWIHIDDLCGIYLKAIEDEAMNGAYNGVAPHPVTNKVLTKEIARTLKKPLWLPPVPGFVVTMIAGAVSEIVLNGGRVSSAKIEDAGYEFQYSTVKDALQQIYRNQ